MLERLFKPKIVNIIQELINKIIFVNALKMMRFYHFHNITKLQFKMNLTKDYKKKFTSCSKRWILTKFTKKENIYIEACK